MCVKKGQNGYLKVKKKLIILADRIKDSENRNMYVRFFM